jgi:hypothetical protein
MFLLWYYSPIQSLTTSIMLHHQVLPSTLAFQPDPQDLYLYLCYSVLKMEHQGAKVIFSTAKQQTESFNVQVWNVQVIGTEWRHTSCVIFTFVPCILILSKFNLFTNWRTKWVVLKNNIKIYIKINVKTAPTRFGAVTPSSRSALIRAYWSYSY